MVAALYQQLPRVDLLASTDLREQAVLPKGSKAQHAPARKALGMTPMQKLAWSRPPCAAWHARWRATRAPMLMRPGAPGGRPSGGTRSSRGCRRMEGLHWYCVLSPPSSSGAWQQPTPPEPPQNMWPVILLLTCQMQAGRTRSGLLICSTQQSQRYIHFISTPHTTA